MRLVLLGAPGSGKGTQAAVLARRLSIPIISSGERLRARAADGTQLGRELAEHLRRGELVPDDLALEVVREAAAGADDGFILDGFPRTIAQAERAASMPELAPDAVVSLAIPDDEARRRMAARDEGRSDDADLDVIDRRLVVFHTQTEPLLEFYRSRGLLRELDATGSPDDVSAAIAEALDA